MSTVPPWMAAQIYSPRISELMAFNVPVYFEPYLSPYPVKIYGF
jgi:hypothetical protein